jgi:hypothetical protein
VDFNTGPSEEEQSKFEQYFNQLREMLQEVPPDNGAEFLSALCHIAAAGFLHAYSKPQTNGSINAVATAMIASAIGTASGDPKLGKAVAMKMIARDTFDPRRN